MENQDQSTEVPSQDEDKELEQAALTALKARADLLNVKYHPSISAEKLREKIAAKAQEEETAEVAAIQKNIAVSENPVVESAAQKRKRVKEEATALVRVNIACNNPLKREWQGEIFSVGNAVVPTEKKYVPFGVEWHIPKIMLNMIQAREFQFFKTETTKHGVTVRRPSIRKEFNVEILPPLTQDELDELERRQAMAAGATA